MSLATPEGTLLVVSADTVRVFCDGLRGPFGYDGGPCGMIRLDGAFPSEGDAPMHAVLTGLPVESSLIEHILSERLSPQNADAVADLKPRGLLDADLSITPDPATPPDRAFPVPLYGPVVRPRSLMVQVGETVVSFPAMEGEVEITS